MNIEGVGFAFVAHIAQHPQVVLGSVGEEAQGLGVLA
jgi:hypothetical protein